MIRTAFAAALLMVCAVPAFAETRTAIVAGGCFWCVEKDFDHVRGVTDAVSGYSGGDLPNPTYDTYSGGGHYEVVQLTYNSNRISYRELLDVFFRTVDPTDPGGQFCDRGVSYSTAVFVANDAERAIAEQAKADAQAALGREIVTPILDAARFWPAENYHQDYYRRAPVRYNYYRFACGRDAKVESLWGEQAYAGVDKD
ncbi:MAG: peptide-methionine (S)-S-oxide reductase MsrA [Pseudomonadota bacterium]